LRFGELRLAFVGRDFDVDTRLRQLGLFRAAACA
jgi:hypothetical protein